MKQVLVLCFSQLHKDPRVRRQLAALHGHAQVTAAGLSDPGGVRFVPLMPPPQVAASKLWQAANLMLRRYAGYYRGQPHIRHARAALSPLMGDMSCIIANDIDALPLALELARPYGVRVLYDAHEYTPSEFEHSLKWRVFMQGYRSWQCRHYMPQATRCITVNAPIADAYARECGVHCEVIMNLPPAHAFTPRPTDAHRIRLIHHGVASPDRNPMSMLEAARRLEPRFEMHFVLVPGDAGLIRRVKAAAQGHARIHFHEPVDYADIVPMLHGYDIGLHLLPARNFNHRNALPNKFFEFIQARLALAISPNPAMAELVQQFGCGVVAADYSPQAMADAINALSAEAIDAMKHASYGAAAQLHEGIAAQQWRSWALEG